MPHALPHKLDRLDGLFALLVALFVAAYTVATFSFSTIPFEDAAILMRFADHMAQGEGIIWNLGEKPVDGATDFLFLVTLGFLGMAGLDVHVGTHVVGIGSHLLTCVFLYLAIRRLHGAPRWMAVLSALYLAVGPGLRQVEAYFGAPYFALFAATTFYLGYQVFKGFDTRRTPVLFALSSLVLGLIRPEGVFLSGFILAAVLVGVGWVRCRRLIVHYVVIFGGLGGTYFLWRWSYFGYPLPNPFYVKGGGSLYPASLVGSFQNVAKLTLPFLPVLGYGLAVSSVRLLRSPLRGKYLALFTGAAAVILAFGVAIYFGTRGDPAAGIAADPARKIGVLWCIALAGAIGAGPLVGSLLLPMSTDRPRDDEETVFVWIPLFAFTFVWILLKGIMNYLERFQYAATPLVLMAWTPVLMSLLRSWHLPPADLSAAARRPLAVLLLLFVFGAPLGYLVQRYQSVQIFHDGTYDIAVMLADHGGPERTIMVTNAGHLPYYSGWSAVDAWGLSDQKIAHEGLDRAYIESIAPDIIQFDGFFSPLTEDRPTGFENQRWFEATLLLKSYAEDNDYILAAAYGASPHKSHYYYVRPGMPDTDELVQKIRDTPYIFMGDSRPCTNWALLR